MTFQTLNRLHGNGGLAASEPITLTPAMLWPKQPWRTRWPFATRAARNDDRRRVLELPLAVAAISRSLRSGATLIQALREIEASQVPLVAADLDRVFDDLTTGASLPVALERWVARSAQREVRIVAAALAFASDNEGGATRALDGLSHSLRDRAALDAEVHMLTAQSSASMQALVVLPSAFLVLDAMLGQNTLTYLTHQPFGRLCLLAGLGLQLVGWIWTRRMIRARLP